MSRRGTMVKGGDLSLWAHLHAYAITLGCCPSVRPGYSISQVGEATPPRTSTPCWEVSFLAVPMVSNHGSWISRR